MRAAARYFRGPLLVAAFIVGAGAQAALAQELQLDPKSLDTSGASVSTKPKGKKSRAPADAAVDKPAAKQGGPNRQFGELEGWSPGKAPPAKPGEVKKPDAKSDEVKAPPIGMSPSGNMSIGLPF